MAVPAPRMTDPTAHGPTPVVAPMRAIPRAWIHMPAKISRLRPPPIGQRSREELPKSPYRRIRCGQGPDRAHRQPRTREEQRERTPRQGVVEVVHQPYLTARGERRLTDRGENEYLPRRQHLARRCRSAGPFQLGELASFPDEYRRARR